MRKGRMVILLAGRRAGRKAIIVKQNDEGRKVSHFTAKPHKMGGPEQMTQ
jgi:ribosomal protein L14E/L6E/L27E